MQKVRVEHRGLGGLLWVAGWLFTIGFLNLSFWKGLAALFIWPAYLGYAVSSMLQVASKLTP